MGQSGWAVRCAACIAALTVPALAQQCTATDVSSVQYIDCYVTRWLGGVFFQWGGYTSGYYSAGVIQGQNACDPGGLNCDGSTRQPQIYLATKNLVSWPGWDETMVQGEFVITNQHLIPESCQTPEQEPDSRVWPYTTVSSAGWFLIDCIYGGGW